MQLLFMRHTDLKSENDLEEQRGITANSNFYYYYLLLFSGEKYVYQEIEEGVRKEEKNFKKMKRLYT